jgi:hypothetical protein
MKKPAKAGFVILAETEGFAYTQGTPPFGRVLSRRPPIRLQANRFESLPHKPQGLCSSQPNENARLRGHLHLAETEGFEPSMQVLARMLP